MEMTRLWKEHEAYLLPKMQKVVQELNEKRDTGEKLTREEERKLVALPERIAEIEERIKNGYPGRGRFRRHGFENPGQVCLQHSRCRDRACGD